MSRGKKKSKLSVLYRENCGGILRDLAAGFSKTLLRLDDVELYDDLRERLFKVDRRDRGENKDLAA